ncbi:hypothetical protein LH460_06255 [Laribacter hongkongensis]|uniref:WYL domain-containing protein n=1 Tax=Laribacter hongkongensis TaxID=168471 RepID=UPI001EFDEBE6|nr:BRCT domain-containing protein [Laribacter hongkongensis]MCG9124273.1 hypothetical protein [Laribacter hongkongensis]
MAPVFGLLLFACSFCFAWMAMARGLKSRGRGFLLRHMVGMVFATVVSSAVIMLVSADDQSWWQWSLAVAITLLMYMHKKAERIVDSQPAALIPEASTPALPQAVENLRDMCQRMTSDGSLDVEELADLLLFVQMHPEQVRSGLPARLASELEVAWADGEISTDEAFALFDLADAVAQGLPELPTPTPRRARSGRKSTAVTISCGPAASIKSGRKPKGGVLDVVSFDYEDASGVPSHRRVSVLRVDGAYIEGRCHLRGAMRTFRLDRVVGDITSEESGEIADPYHWAGTLAGIDLSRPSTPTFEDDGVAGKEVLITGLPAAERARLETLAWDSGMVVRKSVTQYLDYLVAGSRAGPTKLEKAYERGVEVLTPEQFEDMATADV